MSIYLFVSLYMFMYTEIRSKAIIWSCSRVWVRYVHAYIHVYTHTPLSMSIFIHIHEKSLDIFFLPFFYTIILTSIYCFYMYMYSSCRSIQEKKGITNEGYLRWIRWQTISTGKQPRGIREISFISGHNVYILTCNIYVCICIYYSTGLWKSDFIRGNNVYGNIHVYRYILDDILLSPLTLLIMSSFPLTYRSLMRPPWSLTIQKLMRFIYENNFLYIYICVYVFIYEYMYMYIYFCV
jgi:hypothetical protein